MSVAFQSIDGFVTRKARAPDRIVWRGFRDGRLRAHRTVNDVAVSEKLVPNRCHNNTTNGAPIAFVRISLPAISIMSLPDEPFELRPPRSASPDAGERG